MKDRPLILAIETSCDETAVAITEGDRVLANVIASQIELHKRWGGVVPIIAQRAHEENIEPVIQAALKQAGVELSAIDFFAVTVGPGLAIALEVGLVKAKALASHYGRPLLPINHMLGHIYANLAKNRHGHSSIEKIEYPAIALLLSGRHSDLVLLTDKAAPRIIGRTLDDALGEAYDKVARMLGLGYPGGPVIERLAREGNPKAFALPIPMVNSPDYNYSFSGLKTAVLYKIRDLKADGLELNRQQIVDLAASFQEAAFASIAHKLTRAVQDHAVKQVWLGGGVIANTALRRYLRARLRPLGVRLYYPNLKKLCTDNAAMIAVAAYYRWLDGDRGQQPDKIDRQPTLSFDSH